MSMNKKRQRSILKAGMTALALTGVIVAGCSAEPKTPDAAGSKPQGQGEKAQTPEARGSITVSMYERNNIPPEEGNWDKNRWTEWVNKQGPVDVKYITVPRWESLQKFNALFATNSAPDLILEYDTGYRNQWYAQKLLMPLDEVIEQHSTTYKELMKQFPQLKKLGTKDDGKLYEIGKVTPLNANHRIYIREDWLQKLNLPMPATTEELLQTAKAFASQDPDGNGKADTFGLNLSGNGVSILQHMFGFGEVQWRFEGDKFIHEWDRLKAATAFQKQLFDAGAVDKDFLADKNGEKAKQDFMSGKLGMYLHQELTDKDYDALKKNDAKAKLAMLPLPKSEFGQFSPVVSSPIQMVGAINAGAKNPKAVMQYIDFMIKPETARTLENGQEGVHWSKNEAGCPKPIDVEKNKKEISYTADMRMMSSLLLLGKCSFLEQRAGDTDTQKTLRQLALDANQAYVSKDRPIPTLKPEYLPVLPQDLALIVKNTEQQIKDAWMKAVVSGAGYTADQAEKDTKSIWEKSGGLRVDEFYAKWYEANKANAFLLKDLYQFGEDAVKLYGNK
ncbi:putative aldouronate transport system substrate-binding protein [Paenibacillus sp. UNCCL117]|uniref:extracellular solute-binding protein n=1 Tax=unclassified Paenibacillus TaxID=185978 RepID=UPI00088FE3A8|nr:MULTISPECIES: extracellular solute-binding protein [unclassified Paenibacillus]SDD40110.1 putative aldouronate transport system substrate-binding protein [Paenibacillus sp. cl123]SFW48188.1 putative aldouronate transport system substrate-binding protein [Paenibacillus sp. UNCCL117]